LRYKCFEGGKRGKLVFRPERALGWRARMNLQRKGSEEDYLGGSFGRQSMGRIQRRKRHFQMKRVRKRMKSVGVQVPVGQETLPVELQLRSEWKQVALLLMARKERRWTRRPIFHRRLRWTRGSTAGRTEIE